MKLFCLIFTIKCINRLQRRGIPCKYANQKFYIRTTDRHYVNTIVFVVFSMIFDQLLGTKKKFYVWFEIKNVSVRDVVKAQFIRDQFSRQTHLAAADHCDIVRVSLFYSIGRIPATPPTICRLFYLLITIFVCFSPFFCRGSAKRQRIVTTIEFVQEFLAMNVCGIQNCDALN